MSGIKAALTPQGDAFILLQRSSNTNTQFQFIFNKRPDPLSSRFTPGFGVNKVPSTHLLFCTVKTRISDLHFLSDFFFPAFGMCLLNYVIFLNFNSTVVRIQWDISFGGTVSWRNTLIHHLVLLTITVFSVLTFCTHSGAMLFCFGDGKFCVSFSSQILENHFFKKLLFIYLTGSTHKREHKQGVRQRQREMRALR